MKSADLVYVEGDVVAVNDSGIQYRLDRVTTLWVPYVLLDELTTARAVGQTGWFVVPRWFALREKIMRFAI